MKFKVNSEVLAKMMSDLARVVPAKTALPILYSFLLELEDDLLRITACDGEMALRGVVRVDESLSKGRSAVPAKLVLELLKTLPEGPIVFDTEETENSASITWETGKSAIPTHNPDDYVNVSVPGKDAPGFETTSDMLLKLIGKTVFATADDPNRPMLGGIFFDLGAGSSNAVASDSSVLVCHSFETPADTPKGSFILPLKAANVLKGILPKEQPVKAVYDHRSARVAFGQIELTTRLVEGKYPKYRSVIPTDNANVLTVRREDLLRVLKRMAVLADRKTPGAKIVLSYNSMVLSAEDIGMAVRGHEEMKVDYDGDNLKVGMKIPKFMEALSNTESETVELRFKDERRAVLLQPSGEGAKDEGYLVILMPCMTK